MGLPSPPKRLLNLAQSYTLAFSLEFHLRVGTRNLEYVQERLHMFLRESVQHQSAPDNRRSVQRRATESVNMLFLTPWQPKPACSLKRPKMDSALFWMVVSSSTLHVFAARPQKVVKATKM